MLDSAVVLDLSNNEVFFAFLLNETNIKCSSIPLAIVVSEISLFQELGKEDKNIGIELARKAKSSGDLKLAAYTYLNLINDMDILDKIEYDLRVLKNKSELNEVEKNLKKGNNI